MPAYGIGEKAVDMIKEDARGLVNDKFELKGLAQ